MSAITFGMVTTIFKCTGGTKPETICPIILKIPDHMVGEETEDVVKKEMFEMLERIKVALPEWDTK